MDATFYSTHSPMSDPGKHADRYDSLPANVAELCEAIQGLIIHVFHASKYGVTVPEETMTTDLILYPLEAMLDRILEIDPSPLETTREPERRLVGSCRDYALLLCSVLRHRGVPARIRVGFETYFHKNRFGDHWVCEYWREDAQRWTLVDAELDALHREAFDVMFDPQDLPEDAFIVSGEMWRRCVDGRVDPGLCGMLNTWGMAYVRGNLVRDVICLSKVENFPWDGAPLTLKPDDDVTAADLALLEYLADITSPEVRIPEVVAAYETHAELHAQRLPLEEAPA